MFISISIATSQSLLFTALVTIKDLKDHKSWSHQTWYVGSSIS